MKDVAPEHALYNPKDGSMHSIFPGVDVRSVAKDFPGVDLGDPIGPKDGCGAAFAPHGQGYVGFLGDINGETAGLKCVLAMCGLAP